MNGLDVFYIEWGLNNTIHESTGFTPDELFNKADRYSPIYETVEIPPGKIEDPNTKFVLACEIQRTHATERKLRHS